MKILKIFIVSFFLLGLTGCETMHNWFEPNSPQYQPVEPITTTTTTTTPPKQKQNNEQPQNQNSTSTNTQPSEPKEHYPLPGVVTGNTASTASEEGSIATTKSETTTKIKNNDTKTETNSDKTLQ